ncbi:hypothetical protein F8M41_023136 [Gigaspora margarita]|uniref:Uncharacterized protein n=1 Tax=Gigaspora margarita TaxID=4874 RepID=A0A8H4B0X6_GIGMA|nr:hypothetical protein F8M41_023136 [Gigaspora margarita]
MNNVFLCCCRYFSDIFQEIKSVVIIEWKSYIGYQDWCNNYPTYFFLKFYHIILGLHGRQVSSTKINMPCIL